MDLYYSERERMFPMKLDDLIDPFVNAEDGMIYYYRRSTDEIVVLVMINLRMTTAMIN